MLAKIGKHWGNQIRELKPKTKKPLCANTTASQPKGLRPKVAYLVDTRKIYVLAAKGQANCHCCSGECKKSGTYRNKNRVVQRFFCVRCGKSKPLDDVRIEAKQAVQVVETLTELLSAQV